MKEVVELSCFNLKLSKKAEQTFESEKRLEREISDWANQNHIWAKFTILHQCLMISQKFWLRTWKCKSLISSSRFRFSIQTLSKMMSNVRQFLFNFQEVSFWNWCSWVNGKTAARSSVLIRFKTFVFWRSPVKRFAVFPQFKIWTSNPMKVAATQHLLQFESKNLLKNQEPFVWSQREARRSNFNKAPTYRQDLRGVDYIGDCWKSSWFRSSPEGTDQAWWNSGWLIIFWTCLYLY